MEENRVGGKTDAELIATLTEPIARSTAAERMRLHRGRPRPGLRRILVESRVSEIDAPSAKTSCKRMRATTSRPSEKALYRRGR